MSIGAHYGGVHSTLTQIKTGYNKFKFLICCSENKLKSSQGVLLELGVPHLYATTGDLTVIWKCNSTKV